MVPAGQETQALLDTYSFSAQKVALQDASAPEASSPAAFVVPAGQETQALLDTYSFSAQKVASQDVSSPKGSSPAAFVVPAGQETQALLDTYSSSAQLQLPGRKYEFLNQQYNKSWCNNSFVPP